VNARRLSAEPEAIAPDGSAVRVLLALPRGSMAHFELPPGETSVAVLHRTVEEIWYFLAGTGEMWRQLGTDEEIIEVGPGLCLSIPAGTAFQFRSFAGEALAALGITMPPWPGSGEAVVVEGPWAPTLAPGPL
jgi:mannose-6-phosphate isomerase-like protein (cupin superfamily)